MIRGVGARIGLVLLAAAAIAWLAYDLRSLTLDAQGRAEARLARTASQVDRALSLFRQAARGNYDPAARIDEASLLLARGSPRQAADLLDGVVRTDPGNVQAWRLLESATASREPRRAAQAAEQLRVLFGHPVGYSIGPGAILSLTGVDLIAPGRVDGSVDRVRVIGKVAQFEGWSATVIRRSRGGSVLIPAGQILIVSDGRWVAGGAPTVVRADVSRAFGAPLARVGFTIDVPAALLESTGRKAKIQVFGSSYGIASQLPISCPRLQAFSCG